ARSRYRASPESASASRYRRTSCSTAATSRGSFVTRCRRFETSRCCTSAVGSIARTIASSVGITPAIASLGGPSASDTRIARHLTAPAHSAVRTRSRRERFIERIVVNDNGEWEIVDFPWWRAGVIGQYVPDELLEGRTDRRRHGRAAASAAAANQPE